MRRTVAVTVLVLAALSAGCTSDGSSATAAGSATVDVASNSRDVCREIDQLEEELKKRNADIERMLDEAGEDEAAWHRVADQVYAWQRDYGIRLRVIADKAVDTDLARDLKRIAEAEQNVTPDTPSQTERDNSDRRDAFRAKHCAKA